MMKDYSQEEWYIKNSKKLIQEYGDIPPPWIFAPTTHPYSICWRMGGGETHVMILWEWMKHQNFTTSNRIDYIKKYPPPPRWLEWAVDFIWDLKIDENDDRDYPSYFKKLEEIGITGTADFEKDFNDDRWD